VRTPLVSVIGYLEAVVEKRVDESFTAEYLDTALTKALYLRGQINQLFEFAQCDADEIQLTFERLDICELLRQVLIEFLPLIEQEQILLETKIPDEELFIYADKTAVIRICQNLIRNTIEHGKCGKYIGVSVSSLNQTAVIDISDKGSGIAREDLPFIFDRLYKADHARVRGGGLGLAVAKELAEKMKGTVSVLQSVPGNTVFRITFPLSN
jgi:signal transduction histidine kinase